MSNSVFLRKSIEASKKYIKYGCIYFWFLLREFVIPIILIFDNYYFKLWRIEKNTRVSENTSYGSHKDHDYVEFFKQLSEYSKFIGLPTRIMYTNENADDCKGLIKDIQEYAQVRILQLLSVLALVLAFISIFVTIKK